MNERPRGANEFQRLLQRHAADIDQLPQRVMHLVRVGVVCASLDDVHHDDGAHLFILKGGTAMQLRFGITARATTDLDVVFRARVDQWIDQLDRASATNHGESHSRSATKAETSAASPSKSPSTPPPPTGTNSSSPTASHSPPTIRPSPTWANEYPALVATHPDAPPTIDHAITYLTDLITRIDNATSGPETDTIKPS